MKLTTPTLALLAWAALCPAGGQAMAQDEDAPRYSMEDVTACSRDAMRLCKSKMPRIKAIEACMRANFELLSPRCQARFKR